MRLAMGGILLVVVALAGAGVVPGNENDEGGAQEKKAGGPEPLGTPRKLPEPKGEGKGEAKGAEASLQIVLGPRQGSTQLNKCGVALIHGGVIEVQQPRPDTVIIIMLGDTAVAGIPCGESLATIVFDLVQDFQIRSLNPREKPQEAQLLVESQLVGMLRRSRPGCGVPTTVPPATFWIGAGEHPLLEFSFGERTLGDQDKVYINDHYGPVSVVVPCCVPLALHEKFGILSNHPKWKFKRNVVYASFGPTPSRWPEWVRLLDPAPEAASGDLGFRVILRAQPAPPHP